MKRDGSPPTLPSITVCSSTLKRKVWCGLPSSGNGYFSSASSGVMRAPVYSAIRTPFGRSRFAKAPRPAISDFFTTNARGFSTCCVSSESSVPGCVGPRRRLRAAGGLDLRAPRFDLEPLSGFSRSFFARERLRAPGDSTFASVADAERRRRVAGEDFDMLGQCCKSDERVRISSAAYDTPNPEAA